MALFPLPLAATIRAESDLRPVQASLYYTATSELEADIQSRILDAAAVVESELLEAAGAVWPLANASESDAARQRSLATQLTTKIALVSLFISAGQLNPAYAEKAVQYQKQADELRRLLSARIAAGQSSPVEPESGAGSGTVSLSRYRFNALGVLVLNN